MTIWKFPVPFGDTVCVRMPTGARVVSAANQKETLCLYAEVPDPDAAVEGRCFRFAGTGHPIESVGRFIGTVLFMGGDFVLHVYEASR